MQTGERAGESFINYVTFLLFWGTPYTYILITAMGIARHITKRCLRTLPLMPFARSFFMIRSRVMQGICAFMISRVLIAKNVEYMNKIHNYMNASGENRKNFEPWKSFAERGTKQFVCTYAKLETCYLVLSRFPHLDLRESEAWNAEIWTQLPFQQV